MDGKNFRKGAEIVEAYSGTDVDSFMRRIDEIAPGFGNTVVDFCFGDVFARPGLDPKTRELMIVAALTALGNAKPQLDSHINWALRAGASRAEIVEAIVQMGVYAGIPTAMRGLDSARSVFAELDRNPATGAKG